MRESDRKAYIVLGTLEFGGTKMTEIICPHCGESIEIEINMTENNPDHIKGDTLVTNTLLSWFEYISRNTNTCMIYTGSITELYQDVTKFLLLEYSDPTEFGWHLIPPNRLIRVLKKNIEHIEKYGYMIDERNDNIKIYRIGEMPNEY